MSPNKNDKRQFVHRKEISSHLNDAPGHSQNNYPHRQIKLMMTKGKTTPVSRSGLMERRYQ